MTPMIDVVFLLLIFFMLASSFEREVAIQIGASGGNSALSGPPRVIDITPNGLRLNGRAVPLGDMAAELDQVVAKRSDAIVLRPRDGTDLQLLVDVMSNLGAQGFSALVLLE
ncbi:MAG: ExbD/TolR family protein [Boseongicola sp.]